MSKEINDKEIRQLRGEETRAAVEIRLLEQENSQPKVRGYAAVFNSDSEVLFKYRKGRFIERIEPNAFEYSDVRALFNHNPDHILARYRGNPNDTLKLAQDDRGLYYEFEINENSQVHRELKESLQRGDIDQSSFGFTIEEDQWEDTESGIAIRTIKKATVFDVSPVTFPAYKAASVSLRSFEQWEESRNAGEKDKERLLMAEAELDQLEAELEFLKD